MNLKFYNELEILLRQRSLNSRKYTDETVVEIKKLQPGWHCFDKPSFDEYLKYNTMQDEINQEELEELKIYYNLDFPFDKYYFLVQWENGCLVINNKVIYTDYSNSEYAEDFKDLFVYLQTADKTTDLPLSYNFGIIKRKDLYDLIPKYRENYLCNKNFTDEELNESLNRFITPIKLTRDIYLQCCLICYKANNVNIKGSLIENYKKNADGRDDGLLEINNTKTAFDKWIKENHYGHPFEIMRGGNSTHISLYPHQENDLYYLYLEGKAWSRSIETLNAFVALSKAGYPVKLYNEDILLNRYNEKDYVGILPNYMYYSYYNHEFKELFNISVEDSFNWNSFEQDIDIKQLLPYTTLKVEGV